MDADLDWLEGLRKRRLDANELWPPISHHAGQHGDRLSRPHSRNMRLNPIRSKNHMGARRDRLEPFNVRDLRRGLAKRSDAGSGTLLTSERNGLVHAAGEAGE